MKKFDLKKAILENKATFFSSLTEGYDEFKRADKGSKDVTAKDKGEEEVYGAGVKKGEEIEKKKMKMSELKGKIKKMVMAEMALDIDTMENAPESEVDFLAELEGMLGEESPMNDPRTQQVIDMLIDMEVDGETMEYILRKVGMEDQMANQLVNYPKDYAASLSEANFYEGLEGRLGKDDLITKEEAKEYAESWEDNDVLNDFDKTFNNEEKITKSEFVNFFKDYIDDMSEMKYIQAAWRKLSSGEGLYEAKEDEEEEIEVTDEFSTEEPQGKGKIDVTQNADADLTGDKKSVQDNLEAALEAAKALGDDKLATQIGNSLTFFTKQHVVK
jgi:hypothetical protein